MKARSVVFDVFGEYVRERGGQISLRHLSAVLAELGVPPDSARVVMSRLSREGWFDVTRRGRESTYRPSARATEVLSTGLERIMKGPIPDTWDGQWYMVAFSVPESARTLRMRLRTQLSWWGFGPLAPGIWVSPHDRLEEVAQFCASDPSIKAELFAARSRGGDDKDRAARCWDLDGIAQDYLAYIEQCRRALAHEPVGARALAVRVELAHDYRGFLLRDPDLPGELLPEEWPAAAAHTEFIRALAALRDEAFAFYDSVG